MLRQTNTRRPGTRSDRHFCREGFRSDRGRCRQCGRTLRWRHCAVWYAARIYEIPETVDAAKLSGDNNLFEARRLSSSDADLPEFQTIVGNHRIFAHRADKSRLAAINKNVTLAIRPEQIVMSMGASFPEDNLLRAVVTAVKFRGATSLIEFDAAGLKLETRVFKVVGLNIGDECMLGLPPHRILIFKD